MNEWFGKRTIIILAVITVILLLMTAFMGADRTQVTFLETCVNTVLSPFQKVISSADSGIRGFFDHFGDVKKLREDNDNLKKQVARLETENRTLEGYKTENQRLKGLLDLSTSLPEYNTLICQVIAKDSGNWFETFTIDKGSVHGIEANQNVITNGGLVGRVYEVGGTWAKVKTIIDESSSLGCCISRTGDIAVLDGDLELGSQGLCKLSYMSSGSEAAVGDVVETSGLGGIFHKGLTIGKIKEIRPDTQGLTQYAIIQPAVDFNKISEVLVITD